jgi:hypothetical protein
MPAANLGRPAKPAAKTAERHGRQQRSDEQLRACRRIGQPSRKPSGGSSNVELVNSLDEEQKRATREGLREDELALFDLLQKDGLDKASRERVKQASRELLASIKVRLADLDRFWEKRRRPMSRSSSSTKYSPTCPRSGASPRRTGRSRCHSTGRIGRQLF